MKFVLISVVCLLGTALAAPASPKTKRDILPGDPRYGTEHHHHHHHHEHHPHENELEISKALGGYIGSYSVPDYSSYQNAFDFHVPQKAYGPPNYTPGNPVYFPGFEPQTNQEIQLPSFNKPSPDFSIFKPFQSINNGYLAPVVPTTQAPVTTYTSPVSTYAPVVPETKSYLAPAIDAAKKDEHPIDSYGNPALKYESVSHQPAVEHHNLHVDAANDESSVDDSVTVAPVHNDVSVPLVTPIPSHTEEHSHEDVQGDVVEVVKTVTEEPSHVTSPTPAVDHHAVHETAKSVVQPTPSHPAFPQTFSSGYFGNGFDNFGSFDNTGFQSSFGNPGYQISPHTYPQFSSNLGEHGFNFAQGSNTDVFQGGFTSGHVPKTTGPDSFDIKATKGLDLQVQTASAPVQAPAPRPEYAPYQVPAANYHPQLPSFSQSHVPEFPKFEQSHVPEFPKFEQSQLPEFPKFEQTSHVSSAPTTHFDAHHESTNLENFKSSNEQSSSNTQLVGTNGGYVY